MSDSAKMKEAPNRAIAGRVENITGILVETRFPIAALEEIKSRLNGSEIPKVEEADPTPPAIDSSLVDKLEFQQSLANRRQEQGQRVIDLVREIGEWI